MEGKGFRSSERGLYCELLPVLVSVLVGVPFLVYYEWIL